MFINYDWKVFFYRWYQQTKSWRYNFAKYRNITRQRKVWPKDVFIAYRKELFFLVLIVFMEQKNKHRHYSCYLLPAYEIHASSEVK